MKIAGFLLLAVIVGLCLSYLSEKKIQVEFAQQKIESMQQKLDAEESLKVIETPGLATERYNQAHGDGTTQTLIMLESDASYYDENGMLIMDPATEDGCVEGNDCYSGPDTSTGEVDERWK